MAPGPGGENAARLGRRLHLAGKCSKTTEILDVDRETRQGVDELENSSN